MAKPIVEYLIVGGGGAGGRASGTRGGGGDGSLKNITVDEIITDTITVNERMTASDIALTNGVSVDSILDENDLTSDSDTALATQQSIKAYTDSLSYLFTSTTEESDTTPNPTGDSKRNEYCLTALAAAAEFAAPSGTPANGNMLLIRVKDDGTARALTYNAIYDGTLDDLPSTTTISKTLYMLFIYNSEATKWELISTGEEG